MKFTSIPQNNALLDEGLVYDIDLEKVCDRVELSVADLTDGERTVATLRFAQTAFISIDIAPYVRRMLHPEPFENAPELYDDWGRTVQVALRVDGEQSPVRTFSLFADDGLPRILTTFPERRTIASGEFDEVAFRAPAGGRIGISTETGDGAVKSRFVNVPASERIRVFRFSPENFVDTRHISIVFGFGDRSDTLEYDRVHRSGEAVRVAWLASSGAIEYYTFPTRKEHKLSVGKGRIYSRNGYETSVAGCEASTVLVSDYEPHGVVRALEEILSSPCVWRVDNGRYTELDVVSSECLHRADGLPERVSIEIRTRKREEGLI